MALPTYYNAGTVTVAAGGTAVTGVGTAWIAALQPGDLFTDASGLMVRIASIESDTALTLARPWPGGAIAGGAYEIQLTPRSVGVQEATRRLLLVLSNGNLSSIADLQTAADTMAYYTGEGTADLATLTTFARTSILSKATREDVLTGIGVSNLVDNVAPAVTDLNLVTESGWVSIYDGANQPPGSSGWIVLTIFWANGLYATQRAYSAFAGNAPVMERSRSNSGIWSGWTAAGSRLLGPVSQVSGVATGSIIERGSNANGEYTRFADGTQICTGAMASNVSTSNVGVSPIMFSNEFTFTYPAGFVAKPRVSAHVEYTSGVAQWAAILGVTTTTCSGRAFSYSSSISSCSYIAIGRWF